MKLFYSVLVLLLTLAGVFGLLSFKLRGNSEGFWLELVDEPAGIVSTARLENCVSSKTPNAHDPCVPVADLKIDPRLIDEDDAGGIVI